MFYKKEIICERKCERNCERKWNAINESMTDFFVWFVYFEKVKQWKL